MKANSKLALYLIGSIPNDWSYIRMKEIYGKPIRDFGSFSTTKLITFLEEGIPFIKSEMIKEGWIDWTSTQYISQEVHSQLTKSYVTENTILFSKIGSALGKAVVYDGERGLCNSNAAVAKIELDSQQADNNYYCYLLNNQLAKKQFNRLIISLLPRINLGDISGLILPLPPLPEQQKIAKILSTWDKAISTTEKLIKTSKQQKKALMQQLLTGKKRLVNPLTGKEFEGEWEDKDLNYFSKVIVSPVDKKIVEGEIPVELCNYTDVYYNTNITRKLTFMKATAKQSEIDKFTLEVDDVIITKDSETPGDIAVPALVSEDLNGVVCGYHLAIVRADKQQADGAFINYLFAMPQTRYYFFTLATGATRFGLSIGGINKAHFCLPPLQEQQKIASVLAAADKDIEVLEAKLSHLKQEKKALMQQLLTGKIRVQVEESVAA